MEARIFQVCPQWGQVIFQRNTGSPVANKKSTNAENAKIKEIKAIGVSNGAFNFTPPNIHNSMELATNITAISMYLVGLLEGGLSGLSQFLHLTL